MSAPETSTTPPASEGDGLALPVAAIVCISIACYVIVIIAIIVIRNLLIRRGRCQCQCRNPDEEPEPCCTCCLSLNEACNCCSAPSVGGCVDRICPNRKKVDCMNLLLCTCCSDDPAGPCNCSGGIDCLCCQVECHRKDEEAAGRHPRLSVYSHGHQLPQGESYMCIVDHQGNLTKILKPPPHSLQDLNLNNSAMVSSVEVEKGDLHSARSLPASTSIGSLGSGGMWGSTRVLPPVSARGLPSERSQASLTSRGQGPRHQFPAQMTSRSLPVNDSSNSLSSRSHHGALPPLSARSLPAGAFRAKPMGLIPITKDPWSFNSHGAGARERDGNKRSRSVPALGARGKVHGSGVRKDSIKSAVTLTTETACTQTRVSARVQSQLSSDTFGAETQRGGRRSSAWEGEGMPPSVEEPDDVLAQAGPSATKPGLGKRGSIMKGAPGPNCSTDKLRSVRVGWDED